ncbi:MAG: FixH family protein [Thermomicrobiales bacterium]
MIYAGAASTLLVMWASSGWLETPASATLATPAATPCVPVATPLATIGDCVPVGLGTPVVGDDLVVTLIAGSTKAGPVDLILVVRDAAGEAVEDATVEVRTRHIDMDHGVSTDKAVHQGDGRYLAERVSMGMGGNWEAEIVVRREGEPDVAVIFHVKLVGPTH